MMNALEKKVDDMTTLEILNPYNLKPWGTAPLLEWGTIDGYLEDAHKLFRNRNNWLPTHKRIAILKKTAEIMEDLYEQLAYTIAGESGKPLMDARVEATRAIDGVNLCIKELGRLSGEQIPMDLTPAGEGRIAFTQREPIGPVVAVSAFNHPLNLIVHQVAPAVAVGCPVIVKPADDTPGSCKLFIDALYQAGLPEEWCRMVVCDIPTAEKMVTDPRVAFFSFIGSAKVGWMLKNKLAPGVRCALEHGGVAPVIVEETADIDPMLPGLLKGGFYHSGQVCVSVQRVFAPKEMAREIAEKLAEGASKLIVGDPLDEKTECGPLIRPREVERVAEWVSASGGEILTGGKALGETTYAPTVIMDPAMDAKVSTSEIFGPVVSVYGYEVLDEAIHYANDLPTAFQSSIFTKNIDIAMKAVQELDASAVMVNDHTAFRVDWMPFAGRRHSGYGIGGIGHTMHDMTQDKMAVIKL